MARRKHSEYPETVGGRDGLTGVGSAFLLQSEHFINSTKPVCGYQTEEA
jgi:hypothetical protein